ncbi:cell division suppressor protein YneA [Pseudalkalibacillus caeni]|uniref:LysM peptidoglycan-binding domain-containing protein n=1 Tax=Exobacillus caeni TaxID=2574798 RepID=A0A5R9F1B2_9BACL|nr:LysM peptidoglycan-binding domain-containing protein [Pseudalkalibacillus caeni]TLS37422.1 LysM peptidoglycan-binding domain-containing protein [Pseudalkalibacillus caeni]
MKKSANQYTGMDYLLIVMFVMILLFVMTSLMTAASSPDLIGYKEVTVQAGDTLWDIADEYEEDHELSNEKFVSLVEKANGVNANNLIAGEVIRIPVEQ